MLRAGWCTVLTSEIWISPASLRRRCYKSCSLLRKEVKLSCAHTASSQLKQNRRSLCMTWLYGSMDHTKGWIPAISHRVYRKEVRCVSSYTDVSQMWHRFPTFVTYCSNHDGARRERLPKKPLNVTGRTVSPSLYWDFLTVSGTSIAYQVPCRRVERCSFT